MGAEVGGASATRLHSYGRLLASLSASSVAKHFDAYTDVPWDAPGYEVDPRDPRWELPEDHPLATTGWYRRLPAPHRARLGLDAVADMMKTGVHFESVVQRGLLAYADRLPNGSPEFRYAYHEVIEEAHHSLMFQELVNRSGADPDRPGPAMQALARWVVSLARRNPALFFFYVLAAEEPVNYLQRAELRRQTGHPLLLRIMRIHVTEESRHVSFARGHLRATVPALSPLRRRALGVQAPLVMAPLVSAVMRPSPGLLRRHGIPAEVVREAYDDNPAYQRRVRASVAPVRRLCADCGLLDPAAVAAWKRVGLWDERTLSSVRPEASGATRQPTR